MSECACGERFRTAEDYRDHLPCEPKRSCNRHDDCDFAEERFKSLYPEGKQLHNGVVVRAPDHCDDSCCEECFGS